MITMQQICRTYDQGETKVHALREVDLMIDQGEYVSILGPSGSGKSTLMHLLGCLDTPSAGSYLFEGEEVGHFTIEEKAKFRNRDIGFVFQRFHLLPRSSAMQNIMMPMRFARVPINEQKQRAADLLERVGLTDRATHKPSELSGGQQQRVAIARALANRPRLLLADEPTGNLDSESGRQIVELLEELNQEGTTVIIVTHDESLAERTNRVLRMLDGRIASDGATRQQA
ncbi:MAG: macrolide ABC transporter ATP-binding protein [Planctomycetota bacterium]|nr:MAG: macrolide ABC transporter ATP-binding protein [Planctomycetota bacterium]